MIKFRVGDRVVRTTKSNCLEIGKEYTVAEVSYTGVFISIEGYGSGFLEEYFDLVTSNRHKHYNEIVAWAEGETIQAGIGGVWYVTTQPHFRLNTEYRVKPSELSKAELALSKAKEDLANAKALVKKLESQS